MHLRPCSSCLRHVRADEATCPFCSCALAPSDDALPDREPRTRLSRAATHAFGIGALATSLVACKDAAPPPAPPAVDAATPTASATPEASAPIASAEADIVPPTLDASTASATDAALDAAKKKVVTPAPTRPPNLAKPYGAPPAGGLRIV
jgi:hypothetical protein